MRNIFILLTIILISCSFTRNDKLKTGFYVPQTIEWANPESGIEDIDKRYLASFPIYFFNTDSIFYKVSSTNELLADSIIFGIETGFLVEKCLIKEIDKAKIIFEKEIIYSVVSLSNTSLPILDTIFLLNNEKYLCTKESYEITHKLKYKSKERIENIINDFGE